MLASHSKHNLLKARDMRMRDMRQQRRPSRPTYVLGSLLALLASKREFEHIVCICGGVNIAIADEMIILAL